MPPRRPPQPTPSPEPRQFGSAEEIDRVSQKLQRRLDDVMRLDPATVRHDSPEVDRVQSAIRATILDVFGPRSPDYLEREHYALWKGGVFMDMDVDKLQEAFVRGVEHARHMLEGLIQRRNEQKLDPDDLRYRVSRASPLHRPSRRRLTISRRGTR